MENKLWACERQLDKLRDKRSGLWRECKEMQTKVGVARAEVDKLFGAAEVDTKLAGVEKLDVEGLGRVEIDMDEGAGRGECGSAEVYRLDADEGEWMDTEQYAEEVGGAWDGGAGGAGADGADQAVEQ